ncbi:MAG: nuclear transport factor 2 family protein [Actinomycetota bacterium]|nr:nuclear transport factor 2 family protein [Actinomycetota bacterium]
MTPEQLTDIREVEQLKYRYCRLLDQKRFVELGELLAEHVTADYGGGAVSLTGRAAVVTFLQQAMGSTDLLSSHLVSHPEITLTGPDSAEGIWALRDVVILTQAGLAIRGASTYADRYARVNGEWIIAHTGYRRLYEEIAPRPDGVRLTASWWTTEGRSSLV